MNNPLIPVKAVFNSDMESKAVFSIENSATVKAKFKTRYKKTHKDRLFSGNGYTGDIITNELL